MRSESQRLVRADFTYINFTENNVYYAANHNQRVENIPGISKIALGDVKFIVGNGKSTHCKVSFLNIKIDMHTPEYYYRLLQQRAHEYSALMLKCTDVTRATPS